MLFLPNAICLSTFYSSNLKYVLPTCPCRIASFALHLYGNVPAFMASVSVCLFVQLLLDSSQVLINVCFLSGIVTMPT